MVASHFDAHGTPNGWQVKQAFYGVLVGATILGFVLVFAMPAMIAVLPAQLINLPNKSYWLAPPQMVSSQAFLQTWFAWFGCAVYMVIILAFDYAVKSNLQSVSRPDPAHLWYGLAAFGAFSLFWMIRFFMRFARLPREISNAR